MNRLQKIPLSDPILVLPLGATEYHGPHLPLSTDTIIAQAFVERCSALMPDILNVHFLNVEPIGYSVEHMTSQGTQTLSWNEAIERWITIGTEAYHQGTRKFVLFNCHGGNFPLLTIVATELRKRFPMLAVVTGWRRFGLPEGLLSEKEAETDIHAGFIETSMMLALAPEQVIMASAQNFTNHQRILEQNYQWLRAYGKHSFGWMMHDLNPAGAAGNAFLANKHDGEKILLHATSAFIQLLLDIHAFDLHHLQ